MALNSQLSDVYYNAHKVLPPDFANLIQSNLETFRGSFQPDQAIKAGDTLPEFRMPNALGKEVSSTELLAQGPLLLNFYRGSWCPYCNLTLNAYQKHLPALTSASATLVAISPELPNTSLTLTEKSELSFPVLSDVDNAYAKKLGILFTQQADELRPYYEKFGIDMEARTGNDGFDVPVPATILVGRDGVVRKIFMEVDFTKRLEPETALEWVKAL